MVRYLYTLSLRLYRMLIGLSRPFSEKARHWTNGRRDLWSQLEKHEFDRPVWIHCSSLGEFEQGRPLIEAIKNHAPRQQVLLTFFSPSGYLIRKNYGHADVISYLPLDTPANARKFLKTVNPSLALFVKYDFWFNHMQVLSAREIPFVYVSLIMQPGHFLLRPVMRPLLHILARAQHLFTQDQATCDELKKHGISQVTVAGDNRIDRVLSMTEKPRSYPIIESLAKQRFTVILGSVWEADMEVVAPYLNDHLDQDHQYLIASHEVDDKALLKIEGFLSKKPVRFSGKMTREDNIILIDTIGDLAHLYQYADLAYIGGGFGKGIHSILEPAAIPLPIIFGPNYHKFREARDLIQKGGAVSVKTPADFEKAVNFFRDAGNYQIATREVGEYMNGNKGATSRILQYLVQHKLLA